MDLYTHEGEIPYGGGLGNSPPLHHSTTNTEEDHHHHHHHQSIIPYTYSKKGVVVRYRECLKNHAASIGGDATDGCGEFMPSGEEGTLESFNCSACSCHRNFHRKEVEGEPSYYHHHYPPLKVVGQKGVLISGPEAFGYSSSPTAAGQSLIPLHPMIMPLQASESDEMVRKRSRTKFTAEQRETMLGFAEKVGWSLQRVEESVVHQFCQELGVKRRVLKVWIHNNKHTLAKKINPPA